jgi:hypothetical protein
VLVGCLGSLITFIVTYLAHRYYAIEVRNVFFTELEEEQERIFRTAEVGELINIHDEEEQKQENKKGIALTECENQTEASGVTKKQKDIEFGWKFRDIYRQKILTKKDPYKKKSILQMHSKRLNLYEECRALQIAASAKLAGKDKKLKGDYF